MQIVWDEEDKVWIERWWFMEWIENQAFKPSDKTLKLAKEFQFRWE